MSADMVPTPSEASPGYPAVVIALVMSTDAVSVPRRSPSPMRADPKNRSPIAARIASTARTVTPVGRGAFGCMVARDSLRN